MKYIKNFNESNESDIDGDFLKDCEDIFVELKDIDFDVYVRDIGFDSNYKIEINIFKSDYHRSIGSSYKFGEVMEYFLRFIDFIGDRKCIVSDGGPGSWWTDGRKIKDEWGKDYTLRRLIIMVK